MTDAADARASLDRAQTLLEQVNRDAARFDEFLAWLADADARVRRLDAYHRGQGQADTAAVLAADDEAVTPPVANEDSVWEAVVDFDERMRRLLRVVTGSLTATLDEPAAE